MVKKTFFILQLICIATYSFGQNIIKEGKILYDITYQNLPAELIRNEHMLPHDASFYFKGEGDRSVWLSPHDEIETGPCDAAPEEIDIATAIDRFERVVDWPIERVERSWAGLRSFAPDRLPVYGFDPDAEGFFWCAGQGGFGIQTSPAAAKPSSARTASEATRPAAASPNRRMA